MSRCSPFIFGVGCYGSGGGGGGATLTIEISSDAGHTTPIVTGAVNSTAYIRATPTGITPTSYQFYSIDVNGVMKLIAEQASADFTWVINSTVAVQRIFVHATDDDDNWVGVDTSFTVTEIVFTKWTQFNGTNQYVSAAYQSALEFGTSARTYVIDFSVDVVSGLRNLLINFTGSTGIIFLMDGASMRTFINTTSASVDSSSLSINTRYQLLVTYNGSGTWYVYMNGTLVGTRSNSDNTNTGLEYTFGQHPAVGRWFDGNVGRPIMYNVYFDASKVTEIYNGGTLVDPRSLSTAASIVEFWGFGNGGDNSPTIIGQKGVRNVTMFNMTNANFINL